MILNVKIPELWQQEINNDTAFGRRVLAGLKKGPGGSLKRSGTAVRKDAQSAERVGTALKSRIERLITIKTGKGCGCSNLAIEMDAWGIKGCESRRADIVSHLVSNRDILISALHTSGGLLGHAAALGVSVLPDSILQAGADHLLTQAIEDVRKNKPVQRRVVTADSPRVAGDAWTPRSGSMTPTSGQTRRYTIVRGTPPPLPDPFTGTPVFHFGGHLWPIQGYWQRHADAWNRLAGMISGRCVVVVVTDESTSPVAEVRAALDPRIEIHVAPNTPHGENPSFALFQSIMPRGQNDILLYAHGKGVRERTFNSKAIDLWIEWMYATAIFPHDRIAGHMAAGYKMVGSFRMFGLNATSDPQFDWHYAGTFFAIRSKYLPGTKVHDRYGGVENWPGQNFRACDCYCELMDNVAMRTLYLDSFMEKQKPLFEEWKSKYAP